MRILVIAILLCGTVIPVFAETDAVVSEGAVYQPTPFTVWLDFETLMRPETKPPAFPIWLESVQVSSALRPEGEITHTSYRLRFRQFPTLNRILLFRLYFVDEPGKNPSLSAWSETGDLKHQTTRLGTGIGLPTSETVTLAMDGVDYLELEIPGDGKSIRGALLTTVERAESYQSVDFAAPAQTIDPFQSVITPRTATTDEEVFGRLHAPLSDEPVILSKETGSTTGYEFDLENIPLLAVLTFEILNADVRQPPQILLNRQPLGPATLILPDLADPGYTGTVEGLVKGMQIRYSSWIRAQCVVPASALEAEGNRLYIQSPSQTGEIAVRSIALQLKYDSETFDYDLIPLLP